VKKLNDHVINVTVSHVM